MIAASGLRWTLTLVFALTAAHGFRRAVIPGATRADRVDHALHTAMGLAMIAMVWPWGMDLAAGPQVVVFVAGALWFVCAAPFRGGEGTRREGLLGALAQAVLMGAMAWMVTLMDSGDMGDGAGGGGAMQGMPGMDMSGSAGAATMTLTDTGPKAAAGVLALASVGFALWWLTQAFDRARAVPATATVAGPVPGGGEAALGPACHAAMALGMATMFVLLL
ncbi:DUF5134 domain-containing protein [Streptomyces sp. NBC_00340]|uniref:DUF5134 domain-containing protein n=1 Tax=unclassified Streptomyces TaxID=2593676 RepID=UPI0022560D3A|nr:DUF5134 domain-containing protein [Streptomyces sp. NBC_00340]MCX5134532.1 DUF5134 domain-containing protein [Streptomyces sp. NBC_00340]